MRTIGAALILATILATASFVTSAGAAEPRWCAVWSDGSRSCAYAEQERCQGAISGTGGKCVESTAADAPAAKVKAQANTQAKTQPKSKASNVADDGLDKLIDRLNKKSDGMILCKGC